MPRIQRMVNSVEPTIYHVMSRTALDGYPLTKVDKDYMVSLIKSFARLYLIDVIGFFLRFPLCMIQKRWFVSWIITFI